MKMNREQLKELGLSDEQIESVMKSYGKATNDLKEQADKVEGLESQIDDYKQQIADRDEQLESLSEQAKDNEELTAEIDRLKEDNKTATEELQEKLDKQAFNHSLDNALTSAGVRNAKAVKALLDVESIKLDGDKLLGLDDQLKALHESDGYLFDTGDGQEYKPNFTAGNHSKESGALTKEQIMQEKDNTKRQRLIQKNAHLFK